MILYPSNETSFTNNGLGIIADAVSCTVTEERNGKYELEMEYPVNGIRFADITERCIIYVKPSPGRDPQPFRIYDIVKTHEGTITVYAEHISYDLSGYPVAPFDASTASQAISRLKSNATVQHPFTFTTDVNKNGDFSSIVPTSTRAVMGGKEGSILDIYHGEWEYDKFSVSLRAARGADNGVRIAYGKNLTKLEQDKKISDVYTGVLPYWYSEQDGLVSGQVQNCPGTFDFTRILTYDFSSEYDEKPSVNQLNARAVKYIQDNNVGVPKVSLDVSFEDLSKLGNIENIELCDIVTIVFDRLNINTSAKVIKTEYDVLLDRYTSIKIGDAKESIADTIAAQNAMLKTATTKSDLEKAITFATQLITGNLGGYVIQHDSDGDGYPDELLVMNRPNIDEATQVWRWNLSGLGYSSHGYAGPYELAMTMAGEIVADFITAGTLNADNVNVTNINGQNVKDRTIGENQISDYAVSHGKTSYAVQQTLAQVSINAADIEAISLRVDNLEARWGTFTGIDVSSWMTFQGQDVRWSTIRDGSGINHNVLARDNG